MVPVEILYRDEKETKMELDFLDHITYFDRHLNHQTRQASRVLLSIDPDHSTELVLKYASISHNKNK